MYGRFTVEPSPCLKPCIAKMLMESVVSYVSCKRVTKGEKRVRNVKKKLLEARIDVQHVVLLRFGNKYVQ